MKFQLLAWLDPSLLDPRRGINKPALCPGNYHLAHAFNMFSNSSSFQQLRTSHPTPIFFLLSSAILSLLKLYFIHFISKFWQQGISYQLSPLSCLNCCIFAQSIFLKKTAFQTLQPNTHFSKVAFGIPFEETDVYNSIQFTSLPC